MADINSGSASKHAARANAAGAPGDHAAVDHGTIDDGTIDDGTIDIVELLFFAYRDFTGEADAVLAAFGFGRAHHRVLHFVDRRPGMRVADLLDILRITKQSLARVLKELVDRGFIVQEAGAEDRRERRLHLTKPGRALAQRLVGLQTSRIKQALDGAGPEGQAAVGAFLLGMVGAEDRTAVARMVAAAAGAGDKPRRRPEEQE